ncbi:MAG: SusC/RagA family TonB-linked outer membrane protein, partial [Bacteroidota bacterium]
MKNFLSGKMWIPLYLLTLCCFSSFSLNARDNDTAARQMTEILEEMSEHYQVFFSYETKLLREIKVDFKFQKARSLEDNMNQLFKKVNLQYKTIGKKYYIIYKPNKVGKRSAKKLERKIKQVQKLENRSGINLQQMSDKKSKQLRDMTETIVRLKKEAKISGVVIDAENGEGLIGVNIVVEGTTFGTVTDVDGSYSINASPTDVLIFTYTGYQQQRVTVGSQTTINVSLSADTELLDEVVVIGYSTQRKSDLTGSVGQVSSEEIEDYVYSDASQALQGRIAGVSVTSQGGAPGADALISIRGTGTLSDAGPLYVIDGMLTSSMGSLNPSDIATVSVLKDASASAIYGSRAANGVVIITTKTGKAGGLNIDFDASYGVQSVINTIDWADAQQYVTIVNRADDNDGSPRSPANDTEFNPANTSNLYDESFQTAPITNANLRLYGGGENTLYSLSLNYFGQDGIVKFSDFERITARANGSFTKGRFKLENTIGLTRTVNNPNPYFNRERNLLPTIRLMDDNGDWNASDIPDVPGAPAIGSFYGQGSMFNELGMAALEDRTITESTILGNIGASFEILNGLIYKLNLGLEYSDNNNYRFTPFHPVFVESRNLQFAELRETNSRFLSGLIEHTLNFKRVLGQHNIDVLAGYTAQESDFRSLGIEARRFPNNNIRIASAAEEIASAPSSFVKTAIQSYFGRINYTFDDRYLLTATVRRDGSSLFKEGLRWGVFPSMAVGWNIGNEGILKDSPLISNLKLRASYGEIGSNNVSAYATDPTLNLFSEYILGDNQDRVTGYSITNGVNPNITWETTRTTNIGIDLGLMENRLNFTLDYFIKNSEDVLVGLRLPLYTGFGNAVPFNTASIENKGFEFLANYNEKFGDLGLSLTGNFLILDNVVTALGDAT